MPWTRRQVKYLLSKVSPLSASEKAKMKGELHEAPSLGHRKKGTGLRDHIADLKRQGRLKRKKR